MCAGIVDLEAIARHCRWRIFEGHISRSGFNQFGLIKNWDTKSFQAHMILHIAFTNF